MTPWLESLFALGDVLDLEAALDHPRLRWRELEPRQPIALESGRVWGLETGLVAAELGGRFMGIEYGGSEFGDDGLVWRALRPSLVAELPVDALPDLRREDADDDRWARMHLHARCSSATRRMSAFRPRRLHAAAGGRVHHIGVKRPARRQWEPHRVMLTAWIRPLDGGALAVVAQLEDLDVTEVEGARKHRICLVGEPRDGALDVWVGWAGDRGALVHGRRRWGLPLLPATLWSDGQRRNHTLVANGEPIASWHELHAGIPQPWSRLAPRLGLDPEGLTLRGQLDGVAGTTRPTTRVTWTEVGAVTGAPGPVEVDLYRPGCIGSVRGVALRGEVELRTRGG